jgi:hypothetical protein
MRTRRDAEARAGDRSTGAPASADTRGHICASAERLSRVPRVVEPASTWSLEL